MHPPFGIFFLEPLHFFLHTFFLFVVVSEDGKAGLPPPRYPRNLAAVKSASLLALLHAFVWDIGIRIPS